MSKPTTQKRIKFETVYRVRWYAGDTDLPTRERADEQFMRLTAAGVVATLDLFKRPKA